MSWQVINGNSAEILKTYPDNSFDCVVTDPPYGINFLGKAWDSNTGDREVYEQCLRVLKPGGHLLAFSAARTYHHLAMTVETVGFEIRDQIMWIYGSGFPKSQDIGKSIDRSAGKKDPNYGTTKHSIVSTEGNSVGGQRCKVCNKGVNVNGDGNTALQCKENPCGLKYSAQTKEAEQWAGWGTQLKPAHEPIVMARKPVIGSIRENVQEYGTGAINIDATRVGDEEITTVGGWSEGHDWASRTTYNKINETHQGRFPANVIHDGSDEVVSLFPHSTSGARKSTHKIKGLDTGTQRAVFGLDAISGKYNVQPFTDAQADEGSAARFFYSPKVSRKERHAGMIDPGAQTRRARDAEGNVLNYAEKKAGASANVLVEQFQLSDAGNNHPTVKPIALMKYLIKLVTPPGGRVLDPFNGSGSTGCAAVELGFDYTGIELDPNYVDIANKRISHWEEQCKPKTTYNNLFEEY